jgi:L-asparaginase II
MTTALAGAPPVAVLVRRGGRIESCHRVAFAVMDTDGRLAHAAGDHGAPVFPRSAVKPIQALPLVETGAADRFGLGPAELALAAASHSGEPQHTERVRAWLQRLGLSEADLECGAHPPGHGPSASLLAAAGQAPSALHNNCSGKHAGMLTLALHLGVPTQGYSAPDHPVQRLAAAAIAAMADQAELAAPAIDGCGIPTHPLPLAGLALAMARLGAPAGLPAGRRAACQRIAAAMQAHPELVAGGGRACTLLMRALPGVIAKTGAEGVYAAALSARGLGLALKVEDGAGRAAAVALGALLAALDELPEAARPGLAEVLQPALRNHAGTLVGTIEPAPGWPPA